MPLTTTTVFAWAKDLVTLATAAGVVSFGAMKIMDVPTTKQVDQKVAEVESDVRAHWEWNRAEAKRVESLLNCILWEVEPKKCNVPNVPSVENFYRNLP